MRGRAGPCAAVVAALLLASCGDQAEPTTPVITMSDDVDLFPAAIVTGTLELQGGCLTLDDAVALFPAGTEWDDAAEEVKFPDGSRWPIGDEVEGGGGYAQAEGIRDTRLGDDGTEAAYVCAQTLGAPEVAVISGAL